MNVIILLKMFLNSLIRAKEHFSGWMKKRRVKNERKIKETWLHIIFSGRHILGRPDRKVVMMLEKMVFPETVEEFMDEYKIIDSDEVYTNGAALVPIFRMNQWFDHKKGRWIDKGSLSCRCSECGCKNNKETAFCPNCGARMEGNQDADI